MPHSRVIEAVKDRIAARWSAPDYVAARAGMSPPLPEAPLLMINEEGDTPGDGSTFLQIQFPTGSTDQNDLAGNHYTENGTIRVIINTMSGTGASEGTRLADMLATLFRGKKFDGVQTYAPTPAIVDDRNDQGLYWPIAFAVPYDFKFTDTSGQYD